MLQHQLAEAADIAYDALTTPMLRTTVVTPSARIWAMAALVFSGSFCDQIWGSNDALSG